MGNRIIEIDFVKGILISLMVLFHFYTFANAYMGITNFVYCFHMSGFLLISGYLQKRFESFKQFKKAIRKILVPYIIFEVLYLFGLFLLGSILGSQNTIKLSLIEVLNCLFVHPIGTYWYLHTLFICIIVNYVVQIFKLNSFVSLLLTGCALFILTNFIEGLLWGNILYFLIGVFISILNTNIKQVIVPTIWSIIPIISITLFSDILSRNNLSGIGLTIFMLSFLMGVSNYVFLKKLFAYLGKNSLIIVLFSPIFTVVTKQYIHLFDFDSTYLLWAIVSLVIVLILCLLFGMLCDKLRISQFIIGGKMYNKYE